MHIIGCPLSSLRNIKEEIRKKYLSRRELEAEFAKIAAAVDKEVGFGAVFEQQMEKNMQQVKKRLGALMHEKYMPSIVNEGIDRNLVQAAFDKRFEEVKLSSMREFLPGLLPEHQRSSFLDPKWDERDDPVPAWVTIAHVGFMAWTIANAPNPAGQSILKKYFENGVSPIGLLKAALAPTIIVWLCYLILG